MARQTISVKGIETPAQKSKRLVREEAERVRQAEIEAKRKAVEEAARIAAEKKAKEAAAFKALQAKYKARGQSIYYAELYQVKKVDWSRYAGKNVSMHKINRMHGASQAAALRRSAGGNVGAYIFARKKGRTIAESRSYASDVSRIKPIPKRRYPAGSGQGLMDMMRGRLNVVKAKHGFGPAARTLVYRPSEIAKGWHKLPVAKVEQLRASRLRGLSAAAFAKSSAAAVAEAQRQRNVRNQNTLKGIATGTIHSSFSASGKMMSQTVNTSMTGQPMGNTLDYARAQKIADAYARTQGQTTHAMDLRKQQQVAVDVLDSSGNVIGRTTTDASKQIAYGGLMNQPTRDNYHYKISLGSQGRINNPYVSQLLWGAHYALGLKAQAKSGPQYSQGKTIGPVDEKNREPLQMYFDAKERERDKYIAANNPYGSFKLSAQVVIHDLIAMGVNFPRGLQDKEGTRGRATRGFSLTQETREKPTTKITYAKTRTGDLFEGALVGTYEGVTGKGYGKLSEAGHEFWKQTLQNPYATAGESVALLFPGGVGAVKVVPIRIGKVLIPTTTKTLLGTPGPMLEKVVSRVLSVGYGSKIKPILNITEKKIRGGMPDPKRMGIEKITSSGERGFELGTSGPITSKVLTSKPVLNYLKGKGVLTEQDVKLITEGKAAIVKTKGLPKKKFRKDFSAQPFESIPREDTPALLGWFRQKQITLKGSAAQIPTYLPKYARKAGDFDIDMKDFAKAKRYASEGAEALNLNLKKMGVLSRKYEADKTRLYLVTPKGRKKVGEFLSPDDPEGIGQLAKSGRVFGKAYPKDRRLKTEGVKHRSAEFQLTAKGVSTLTVQKDAFGKIRIGPPEFRGKDFPDFHGGVKTAAAIYREKGQTQKAADFERYARTIKQSGEKQIGPFEEFYKGKGLTEKLTIETGTGAQAIFVKGSQAAASISMKIGKKSGMVVVTVKPLTPNVITKGKDGSTSISLRESSSFSKIRSVSNYKLSSSSMSVKSASLYKSVGNYRRPSSTPSPYKSPGSSPSLNSVLSPKSPGSPASPKSPGSPGSPGSPTYSPPYSPPKSPVSPPLSPPTKPPVTPTRIPPAVAGILFRTRIDQPIRRPRKHRADFLGNAHVAKITGFAKRAEITYGRKKTFALTEEDIRKSAKGKFSKRKNKVIVLAKHKNLITASKKIRL